MNLKERQDMVEALLKAAIIVQKYVDPDVTIAPLTPRIAGTASAWENGKLGRDARYARRASPEAEQAVDAVLGIKRKNKRGRK